MKKGEVLLPGS